MKQQEIWYANLDPIKGREQSGIRPVVIVSGNNLNDHSDLKIVCPITSQLKKYTGSLLLEKDNINKLAKDSEVLVFQIRTIDETRLIKKIGLITNSQMETIRFYLDEILSY
ncbi:MAG: type II toxin-antitoxin system PemK/MazF family toxin [Bacteroidota bacterium]|nr:type II toxin-antitoxin system PemK/MazF family toxin [Bacteroidota bacterium]